jgi:ABC-type bacteriocin/lantibiotic exporter with double-glycine peptidase domain
MLLGLTRPTEGRILLNGQEVNQLTLADRKRLMLYQRSQAAFFNGQVIENIAVGRSYPSEQIEQTIADARLANRLGASDAGKNTPMTERGEPFSQGEQQRIAIARAFLSDRPCIILDEALNSLDEQSEIAIVEALDRTLAGRTMIMISHRRSVADRLERLFLLRRTPTGTTFEEILRA